MTQRLDANELLARAVCKHLTSNAIADCHTNMAIFEKGFHAGLDAAPQLARPEDAEMRVTYALQPLPKSIFLAGPTPRSIEVPSWRPEAVRMLREDLRFDGTVFVPESADGKPHNEYDHQISWEWEAINQATIVVFWVPRELATMPAFTTNVEFGYLAASGKVVLGAPPDAKKMGYLKALAHRHNIPVWDTLWDTLAEAVYRTQQVYGRFKQGV